VVRGLVALVLALLGIGLVSAVAQARREPAIELAPSDEISRRIDEDPSVSWGPATDGALAERVVPFLGLSSVHIVNINTEKALDVRLYDLWGNLDGAAASQLDGLLGDSRDRDHVETTQLDRRTLQLMFRAAYHFRAKRLIVISAYRKPGTKSEGRHAQGKAIDFKLTNTSASALAAYLRTFSRVGVGVYTNPDTQYVHLDVREQSYYWIDGSPPGRTWRERPIWGTGMAKRDAAYSPSHDWPEGAIRGSRRFDVQNEVQMQGVSDHL
jgi:uncharacterized protein YcbK (DUF882 family)